MPCSNGRTWMGILSISRRRYAERRELEMLHASDYLNELARTAEKAHCYLDPDTETTPKSYETACLAVGGLFNAIDEVMAGEVDNAFALIRPAGSSCRQKRGFGILSVEQCSARRHALP